MRTSLIEGLVEKDMEAMMTLYTLTQFFFPTLFPLKYTADMTWKQLEGEAGAPIAGDVISYDATSKRKRREKVEFLKGNIPKITTARDKEESDINEYRRLLRYAGTEGARQILDWIWNDQEFCYNGNNARLEFLALKAASLGKVTLTATNNDGVVTDSNVDFLIPEAQKIGVAVPITIQNAATSKPISLFKNIVKAAKAKGKRVPYAYTDQATVDAILASDETLKVVAPWVFQATNLTSTPNLASFNAAMRGLNLPQFQVIDSMVTLEIKSERETVEPWEQGVIHFSPTVQLGATLWTDMADEFVESTTSLKAKRGHVLIKRFAQEEPLVESCLAMSNAFPVMADSKSRWLVDTQNTTWNK